MTRKSKRELEHAIDDLTDGAAAPPGESFDVREHVTAPFVTYRDTGTLPDGVEVTEVVDDDGPGATFTVVEATGEGDSP